MKRPTLDKLIRLPEEQAVQAFFDGGNSILLRRELAVLTPGAVVGVVAFATSQQLWRAGLWLIALAFMLSVLLIRNTRFYERNARLILMATMVVTLMTVVLSFDDPDPGFAIAGFLFPLLLIFHRMRSREYLLLATIFSATAAWFVLGTEMIEDPGGRIGSVIAQIAFGAIVVTIAIKISRRLRESFLSDWRHAVASEQERSRMRTELHDAREIQLSMLPKHPPRLDWLDYSSISLPASEVGGDYFEYFVLSETQLAVVIGDVAGHGVASGLVLSGVRSGLHLLRERLDSPLLVIEKLNRMVRDTAPARMFVTLQVALLDSRTRMVTVANAGHPPLVKISQRNNRLRALGAPGLPIGTRLDPGITEVAEPLENGDTLVFYTDGVPEVRDLHGRDYGQDRLHEELRRSSRTGSARQIRDAVLNSISSFKADVAQEDDLTLLVLKFR